MIKRTRKSSTDTRWQDAYQRERKLREDLERQIEQHQALYGEAVRAAEHAKKLAVRFHMACAALLGSVDETRDIL